MTSKITCDKYIQEIIMDALKLYYKLGLVELEVLNDFEPLQNLIPEESRENFKESLKANKDFWGYSENTHLGIASSEIDEKVQTAARIYRAIKLHRVCLDNTANLEGLTEESSRFGKFDQLFDKELDFSIIMENPAQVKEETNLPEPPEEIIINECLPPMNSEGITVVTGVTTIGELTIFDPVQLNTTSNDTNI
jgi:hypothetical protein